MQGQVDGFSCGGGALEGGTEDYVADFEGAVGDVDFHQCDQSLWFESWFCEDGVVYSWALFVVHDLLVMLSECVEIREGFI